MQYATLFQRITAYPGAYGLQGWVETEAKSAEIYLRLEETARRWQQGQAGLWRSPDLDLALQWRATEQPNAAWA